MLGQGSLEAGFAISEDSDASFILLGPAYVLFTEPDLRRIFYKELSFGADTRGSSRSGKLTFCAAGFEGPGWSAAVET